MIIGWSTQRRSVNSFISNLSRIVVAT